MSDLPEPLTPADCDLRGLPFMPLDVVRLGDSDLVALSTGDEFKAAVLLWGKSWLQVPAGSLPDNDRVLAHLSSTGPGWQAVKEMALRGWVKCSDGRLYHSVIAAKACDAWKARLAQRARANKRWHNEPGQQDQSDQPAAVPDAEECAGSADASAEAGSVPSDSGGNAIADAVAYAAVMQGRGRGTVQGKGELPLSKARAARSEAVEMPSWMPMDAWNGFLGMRQKMRKPPTPHAVSLIITQLTEFRARGIDVADVLNQSTRNNWTSLIEPRGGGREPGGRTGPARASNHDWMVRELSERESSP